MNLAGLTNHIYIYNYLYTKLFIYFLIGKLHMSHDLTLHPIIMAEISANWAIARCLGKRFVLVEILLVLKNEIICLSRVEVGHLYLKSYK